jgi:threonine/homoserine/homoserine lactone efflux protein
MGLGYLWINGVALGLGAAAPIGPVNVEIARRVLRFGRGAGFLLGCGAVTVDVGYAVVTSVTFLPVMGWPRVINGLSVAAGLFLAYLGWGCLKAAWGVHGGGGEVISESPSGARGEGSGAGAPGLPPVSSPGGKWGHYGTGLLMTALNPMTLVFWFVGVPGAVARLASARPGVDLPVVCAGVFIGAFTWVCGFTTVVGHLRKFGGRQRWVGWIDLGGGLMLLAFAGRAIWRVAASSL